MADTTKKDDSAKELSVQEEQAARAVAVRNLLNRHAESQGAVTENAPQNDKSEAKKVLDKMEDVWDEEKWAEWRQERQAKRLETAKKEGYYTEPASRTSTTNVTDTKSTGTSTNSK